MTTETITIDRDGVTLSRALWDRYKRLPNGLAEACLDLNQGLAANEILPVGATFAVPLDVVTESLQPERTVIRLWS